MKAAHKGHLEVVTRLIEAGAKVDLQNKKVSPASTAASGGVVAGATGVRVCGLGIGISVKGRVLNAVRRGEVAGGYVTPGCVGMGGQSRRGLHVVACSLTCCVVCSMDTQRSFVLLARAIWRL